MSVFAKLNHKEGPVLVIDPPASFEPELAAVPAVREPKRAAEVGFVIAFCTELRQVQAAAKLAARTEGDAIVWIAYPKGTSKRYRCAFNRDTGFDALGAAGFEGVRQVAIDEDWSALRFRRAAFIKAMARDPKRAMSAAGKAKVAAAKSVAKKKPAAKVTRRGSRPRSG